MAPLSWARLPTRTVRLRLTALYGALFLASGAGLLAVVYWLFASHRAPTFFRVASIGRGGVARVVSVPAEAVGPPCALLKSLGAPCPPPGNQFVRFVQGSSSHGAFPARPLKLQASLPTAGELHYLLFWSAVALAVMAVVSIYLGWVVSGRVLRPLRAMTATARQISEENLHERLSVRGPQDELKDLGDTIDSLLGRLETAFDAQRRFVANASHELRTPLAMVRTSVEVAAGKVTSPPEVQVLASKVGEGLDKADRLLEGLLVLARAQQGAIGETTEMSLAQLVEQAVANNAGAIKDMRLVVRTSLAQAAVLGNEALLARMVANMVENGVRHNAPGGDLSVSVTLDRGVASLVVDSGGAVLDEEQVRQIGEPFYRPGNARIDNSGAGLGLSIVKAITIAHGGVLELRARAEGGLSAVVALPAAPLSAPVPAPA